MTPRLVKQLLYGALYLFILAVIFGIIYFIFLRPAPTCFDGKKNQGETGIDCGGPCSLCELSQLDSIKVNWVVYFPGKEGETSLLAEIVNPNSNFGVSSFFYQFKIIGKFGTLLEVVDGESFIYSSEVKYLMAPSIKLDSRDISRVELIIKENLVWQKNLVKPQLKSFSVQKEERANSFKIKGFIRNEEMVSLKQLKIIALIFDNSDQILNTSQTFIEKLKSLEQAEFSVELPKGDWINQMDFSRTKVFVEAQF